MKHWFSVAFLSIVLCFLFGAWWGHRLQDQREAQTKVKTRVIAAAQPGFFTSDFLKLISEKHHIVIELREYVRPGELMELLNSAHPPEMVQFSSFMFKSLLDRELLGPLDTTLIPHIDQISKDLRHVPWDPQENFALPVKWDSLFFIYPAKNSKPPADSLKAVLRSKKLKVSLKKEAENVMWLAQVLGQPPAELLTENSSLPWTTGSEIERFKKGEIDLLQISWSELQKNKDLLGAYEVWHPSEKAPFYVEFLGLAKHSAGQESVYQALNAVFDPAVYPELLKTEDSAAVLELGSKWAYISAKLFRQLPLTHMKPSIQAGFEIQELDQVVRAASASEERL